MTPSALVIAGESVCWNSVNSSAESWFEVREKKSETHPAMKRQENFASSV